MLTAAHRRIQKQDTIRQYLLILPGVNHAYLSRFQYASSQSSIYQVLDADNGNHPTLTKRKPLHELLKEDEEAFETSLRALCLGVKKKTNGLSSSMISNLSIPEDCEI